MKALYYISIVVLIGLSSCNSALYTGAEYDDLYYLPSDRPISESRVSVNSPIQERTLKAENYYDNIYAADTLVSDQYSDAVDYDDAIPSKNINNNYYYGSNDYFDNYSYSGRIRRFYGNYFDPYWRDPFYSGYYSPFGYSYGYGGFPYSNYYDPFYSDYYGGYYGGYYGSYMGGYYSPFSYGSYYNSYYSPFGYYSGIRVNESSNSIPYGRRERQSNLSSRWNGVAVSGSSTGRDTYLSSGRGSNINRRNTGTSQAISSDSRRSVSSDVTAKQVGNETYRKSVQDNGVKSTNPTSREAIPRSSVSSRPEYNNVNRTYTPTYSNPRMSTRPSYNNSRISGGTNSGENQNSRYINTERSNSSVNNNGQAVRNQNSYRNTPSSGRASSTTPSVQSRSGSSYGNQSTYSVPTRRSVESSSGFSSGSSSGSRSSNYSGGSSYSGGESRSSYSSSGSSSSSSSSGSSSRSSSGSSSGSSSDRRR